MPTPRTNKLILTEPTLGDAVEGVEVHKLIHGRPRLRTPHPDVPPESLWDKLRLVSKGR